jgi:hypothetical protein
MDHPDERRLLDSQPSVAGAYTAWTTAGVALREAVGNRTRQSTRDVGCAVPYRPRAIMHVALLASARSFRRFG